jgi:hypothetical protein
MHIDFEAKKIWLSAQAVDFRKAITGLCAIVVEELHSDPGEGILQ